jgi:hypothetical protein
MKKLFYLSIVALVLFEVANVWFIMPLPYSQRVRSIDVAYWLHTWRWWIRGGLCVLALASIRHAWRVPGWQKALVPVSVAVAALVAYATNVKMAADQIFIAPTSVTMKPAAGNVVDPKRLVVGIEIGGDARAYPVQFIGYHHQVRDSVGGRPVLVSFCTVCRTGRVFSPVVDGRTETFRLVGMDHFNAMFEDATTGSWWRQVNGEAVAGPKKGTVLAELPSRQVTLASWLALHPNSLIMQPDAALAHKYAKSFDYETGASRSALTGTDTASWADKAWVVGVSVNGQSKAYDWNRLRCERIVHDVLGGRPIVIALDRDDASFYAFERPDSTTRFTLRGDSLVSSARSYSLVGGTGPDELKPLFASQEFWHSWRTFHPATSTY